MEEKKIVIAITGASGMIYAYQLTEKLNSEEFKNQIAEIAIVCSDNVEKIWSTEIYTPKLSDLNFKFYNNNDFYVPFASGSSAFDVMIIIPCSMGTLGRIAAGISDSLIGRTADVMLKERKKLILVTRETPLSLIHINNMKTITEAGGIICPASPSFYHNPKTVEEAVDTVIERVLDLSGFKFIGKRWKKS
jgi:4-hydroxy-3-polyprenylbenzoate decarboxylase